MDIKVYALFFCKGEKNEENRHNQEKAGKA
jgi:hypothetical protein